MHPLIKDTDWHRAGDDYLEAMTDKGEITGDRETERSASIRREWCGLL